MRLKNCTTFLLIANTIECLRFESLICISEYMNRENYEKHRYNVLI